MPPDETGEEVVLEGFDKLLEHRVRLGVCVLLSRHDRLSFVRLRTLLHESDGSLGAHLRKLEDQNYISVEKAYEGRKPVSWYTLGKNGQRSLSKHLSALRKILGDEA